MKARFPGWCIAGKHKVAAGDEIKRDGAGWSHATHFGPPPSFAWTPRPTYVEPNDRTYSGRAAEDFDDWQAARDRARDDAEYAAGIEDAKRERFNRDMFGESYAAAEEYARDMRGLNGEW